MEVVSNAPTFTAESESLGFWKLQTQPRRAQPGVSRISFPIQPISLHRSRSGCLGYYDGSAQFWRPGYTGEGGNRGTGPKRCPTGRHSQWWQYAWWWYEGRQSRWWQFSRRGQRRWDQTGKLYTKAECVAICRAWDAVTSDPIVGTDQEEGSFWRRVSMAYNEFKPEGALERDPEQISKKWGRIMPAVKRFACIYQNNLMHAASGRSEADIKALSMGQYNTDGWPKFTMWEEYLVLADCPKFKDICSQELGRAPGPKRTRHNLAGDYSSGSGSHSLVQTDEQVPEQVKEPAPTHTRRGRPLGTTSIHP